MRLVLGAVLAITAGCAAESADLTEDTQSVVIDNRIALNRIALNRIALNRIALNRIALNRLQGNLGSIGNLLDTPEGRELFSFVISCALPEGENLEVQQGSNTLTFLGEVGLAPNWESHPMTNADQRWVSACLLSRVNNNGVTVQVSLRGSNAALAATATEKAAWSIEEGAFYGDVFQPDGVPLEMYACRGFGQATLPETGDLDARDCAEPNASDPTLSKCATAEAPMKFAGDCADFLPPANSYACGTKTDDYYEDCAATSIFPADDDDDDDDDHGHGHGGWGGHGHHWGWGHGGHGGWGGGHGHGGHRSHGHGDDHGNDRKQCGHGFPGHGDDDDNDDTTSEVITTYLLP